MLIMVLWNVTPHGLVEDYECLWKYHHHVQGKTKGCHNPEDYSRHLNCHKDLKILVVLLFGISYLRLALLCSHMVVHASAQ
jgi:hypothetical protein